MFEEEGFGAAISGAFPCNPEDPDDLASGAYYRDVDRIARFRWSQRLTPNGAGMYALGEILLGRACGKQFLVLSSLT